MQPAALISCFSGHRDSVYGLCPGAEGFFYSASADGWVVEWQLDKPEEGRLLARMPGSVYSICYLEESERLLVAVNGDGFHLIDCRVREELVAIPAGETRWFRMLRLSDGMVLAAGSSGNLALVNPEDFSIRLIKVGEADVRSLAYFQGENRVLAGTSAAFLHEIDLDGNADQGFPSGHNKTVFALAAYPDGRRMLSAGRDARLILHQLSPDGNRMSSAPLAAHLFGIHDLALHPNKPLVASAGMDKTIKIWDAESLRLLRVLDRSRHGGHSHSVNQLCWLAKPDLLLSCSDDRSIRAWNIYH